MNVMAKYTKSKVDSKIARLEACVVRLNTALEELESHKSRVHEFWDDPQAPEYLHQLTEQIVLVRSATDKCVKMIGEHKGYSEEMVGLSAATTGFIEEIGGVIGSLGIK